MHVHFSMIHVHGFLLILNWQASAAHGTICLHDGQPKRASGAKLRSFFEKQIHLHFRHCRSQASPRNITADLVGVRSQILSEVLTSCFWVAYGQCLGIVCIWCIWDQTLRASAITKSSIASLPLLSESLPILEFHTALSLLHSMWNHLSKFEHNFESLDGSLRWLHWSKKNASESVNFFYIPTQNPLPILDMMYRRVDGTLCGTRWKLQGDAVLGCFLAAPFVFCFCSFCVSFPLSSLVFSFFIYVSLCHVSMFSLVTPWIQLMQQCKNQLPTCQVFSDNVNTLQEVFKRRAVAVATGSLLCNRHGFEMFSRLSRSISLRGLRGGVGSRNTGKHFTEKKQHLRSRRLVDGGAALPTFWLSKERHRSQGLSLASRHNARSDKRAVRNGTIMRLDWQRQLLSTLLIWTARTARGPRGHYAECTRSKVTHVVMFCSSWGGI